MVNMFETSNRKCKNAHDIFRENLHRCAVRQKMEINYSLLLHTCKTGSVVFKQYENRVSMHKTANTIHRPFFIQKTLSEHNYAIQLYKSTTDERVVHYDKLKLYKGTFSPNWMKTICKMVKWYLSLNSSCMSDIRVMMCTCQVLLVSIYNEYVYIVQHNTNTNNPLTPHRQRQHHYAIRFQPYRTKPNTRTHACCF